MILTFQSGDEHCSWDSCDLHLTRLLSTFLIPAKHWAIGQCSNFLHLASFWRYLRLWEQGSWLKAWCAKDFPKDCTEEVARNRSTWWYRTFKSHLSTDSMRFKTSTHAGQLDVTATLAMASCEISKTDMSNFKPAHAGGDSSFPSERAKVFIILLNIEVKSECQLASMCATKLTMHMSPASKDLQVEMNVNMCIFTQPWVIGYQLLQYRLVANVPVKTRFASSWAVG